MVDTLKAKFSDLYQTSLSLLKVKNLKICLKKQNLKYLSKYHHYKKVHNM